MSQELITTVTNGQQQFMPALSVTEAVQRRGAIVDFVREAMVAGVDFGCIPGTPKPTLLKPGAEKLCTLFGLTTRFQIIHSVEDWMGQTHGDEPFFYYLYRCQLWRDAFVIAEGDGSCNSWEQKYRWRDAQRTCPHCGRAAIIKGRNEYGGGWLCFAKKGGCGAKFADGDATIETQTVGRVPSPDVADQVNTIQKMAQKRALIAATLLAVNASEFFTQDEEERLQSQAQTGDVFAPERQTSADGNAAEPARHQQTPQEQTAAFTILPGGAAASDKRGHGKQAASAPREQASAANAEQAAPLIVVEFTNAARATPPAQNTQAEPPLALAPLPVSASEARAAFERKAREQWSFEGRKEMALLAVALLGGKPDRWTAQTWQQAAEQPDAVWHRALASLHDQAV